MLLLLVRMMYLVVCAGAIAGYINTSPHPVPLIEQYKFTAFLALLGITQCAPITDLLIRRKAHRYHFGGLLRFAGGSVAQLFDITRFGSSDSGAGPTGDYAADDTLSHLHLYLVSDTDER